MILKYRQEAVNRLVSWQIGKRRGPLKIDLEPTYSCNLRCKFCWQRSPERLSACNYRRTLTLDRILEIVDEAHKLGVKEWQVAGGWEPTVHLNDFLQLAERIKSYGMYGCVTTNGFNFNSDAARRLVEIGWDKILFSVEGPDSDTHDYHTQVKGSFKRLVSSLKLFKSWKERTGLNNPSYSIHMVLTNRNYNKLKEMVDFSAKLGIESVNFEPLNVWSSEGKKLVLSEKQKLELKKNVGEAVKRARQLGIHTRINHLIEDNMIEKRKMDSLLKRKTKKSGKIEDAPCMVPWLSPEIRVSGMVTPCRLCDNETGCENIIDNSLREIWFGPYFTQFRERMLNTELPSYCSTCAAGYVLDIKELRDNIKNRFLGRLRCLKLRR